MKTLFEKLKASSALDRGGNSLKPGKTQEARRFEESLRTMNQDLRETRNRTAVPTDLHTSVMRAVRRSGVETEPSGSMGWSWRLAATALILALGIGVFWSVMRPSINVAVGLPPAQTQPSFAAAFDRGHELTQAAPQAVLGPLSGEMELLNRDFQNAVNFLAANMP